MKNIAVSFIGILLFFQLLSGQTRSQVTSTGNPSTVTNIFGKVSQIKTDIKQIQVSTQAGENITVSVDDQSEFKRVPAGETTLQNAAAIGFSEIALGDNTFVRGLSTGKSAVLARQIVVITGSDIAKRKEQKLEDWKKRGVSGIVKNVDVAANKISIELKGEGSKPLEIVSGSKTSFQRYQINARSMEDYQPGGLETVKAGDQIRALGNISADGLRYDAEEIFTGSFKVINGKVKSTNPEAGEFTIVDSKSNKTITVAVNKNSNFKRLTAESIAKYQGADANSPGNAPKVINLTRMLESASRIAVSDIKEGEALVIATASDPETGNVIGLTIVSGVELLPGQRTSNTTGQAKKQTFNLDVF